MPHPQLEKLAETLIQQFVNGNRGFVYYKITCLKQDQAALVIAKMCTFVNPQDLLASFQLRVKEDLLDTDDK